MALRERERTWFLDKKQATRKIDLHAPIYCNLCKKEVRKGDRYYFQHDYAAHETCVHK